MQYYSALTRAEKTGGPGALAPSPLPPPKKKSGERVLILYITKLYNASINFHMILDPDFSCTRNNLRESQFKLFLPPKL